MDLDDRDRRLLQLLERDCRTSHAELARAVGMSTSACWRRIKALEEAGVIERYGAVTDPGKQGLAFHAMVHVQLVRHDRAALQAFLSGVAARPEVRACYATTGQADYHLRVRTTDISDYNRFLEEFLFTLPAVRSAQTNVILRDLKR